MTPEISEKVQDAKIEGWNLKERQGDRAIMIRRRYGSVLSHIVVALLSLILFAAMEATAAFFIGNIIYLAYNYFLKPDKRVVRADD